MTAAAPPTPRILVVGSGWTFTSGISYYTCGLANALTGVFDVSVLLMERLVPARLYPGAARVGAPLSGAAYSSDVDVVAGLHWYGGRDLLAAVRALFRRQDVVVLQWWTAAVLHHYLLIALLARHRGARIVLEVHEVQDTGEVALPLVRHYTSVLLRPLLSLVTHVLVHSEFDRQVIQRSWPGVERIPVSVVPHGPFTYLGKVQSSPRPVDGPCRLLFFGTIRPYKGLEHLVQAFSKLPPCQAEQFTLSVIGETWEGWELPRQLIEQSPFRDRITFRNEYVSDDDLRAALSEADVVVLPYLRSSASGPLHLAMSCGLPVIVSDVGGLREAAGNYDGAVLVPPGDDDALQDALIQSSGRAHSRHADVHSWDRNVAAFQSILGAPGVSSRGPGSSE